MAAKRDSGRERGTGPRRRRGGALAVAAIVLAIAVVGPAYFATRPEYFRRYPGMADKYDPWAASTHVDAGCEGCHVPPGTVPRTLYRLRMAGEFYLSIVAPFRVPDVLRTPTNEACLLCHNDLRTVSPEGDLRIPHRAHVSILKMDCVQCHSYLVHETSPEGRHTPPMAGCLECHDGDTAKDSCSACHTQKDAPENHRAQDWLIVHGSQTSTGECEKCHRWAERWCAECHTQRPVSHTADWRAVHGSRVEVRRNCEACHDGPFCVRCHGEVPALNLDPTLEIVR